MNVFRHFFWAMVLLSLGLHALASRALWPQPKALSETDVIENPQVNLATEEAGTENQGVIPLVQIPTADIPSRVKAQKSAPNSNQPLAVSPPIQPEPSTVPPVVVLEATEESVEMTSQLQAESQLPVEESASEEEIASVPETIALETGELETDELETGELETREPETRELETDELDQTRDSQPSESVQLERGMLVSLTDFPHLSDAQSGCFGLDSCHRSQGSYRAVVQQLTAQMRQNGYQLSEKEDIDGAGHRVFEVIDPDSPDDIYYLNVFSDGLDSAVYALTAAVLSLEELKNLNA